MQTIQKVTQKCINFCFCQIMPKLEMKVNKGSGSICDVVCAGITFREKECYASFSPSNQVVFIRSAANHLHLQVTGLSATNKMSTSLEIHSLRLTIFNAHLSAQLNQFKKCKTLRCKYL